MGHDLIRHTKEEKSVAEKVYNDLPTAEAKAATSGYILTRAVGGSHSEGEKVAWACAGATVVGKFVVRHPILSFLVAATFVSARR